MRRRNGRPRLGVDVTAFVGALYILTFREYGRILLIITAVAVHELGHLMAAYALRIKISSIRFSLTGARIETDGCFSYKKEILLCLAGPLFNIIVCLLSLPFCRIEGLSGCAEELCRICLMLAAFNLLPIRGFDGGRILFSLIAIFFGINAAEAVITATGCTLISSLWVISVYMLIRFESALSLFVFSVILFLTTVMRSGLQQ